MVVGAGEEDPIWKILETTGRRYSETLATIEVRYAAPRVRSVSDQIQLLRSLSDKNLSGVCVQVTDPIALEGVLDELEGRGVAVVTMIHAAGPGPRAGLAGVDDEAIGAALADCTARILRAQGTIMVLRGAENHPVYGPRYMAFRRDLRRYSNIETFADIDCHDDTLQARQIVRERSERYPRLSAWVSMGDWLTRDVKSEAELGLPPGCKLITAGGAPAHWPLIRSGVCAAAISAEYRDIAPRAIQACEDTIAGGVRALGRYVAPVRVVEPANLDAFIADWTAWTGNATSSPSTP